MNDSQQVFGGPEQQSTLSAGLDEDILMVAAGKEFTLVRTVGGRVSFSSFLGSTEINIHQWYVMIFSNEKIYA